MKLINDDVLKALKTIETESIQCVITSPPYWNLRDYGVEGQLGLESTFEEYINKLCNIFDEVKRVLKKDGSIYVNIGDTYSTVSGSMDKGKWSQPKNPALDNFMPEKLKSKCLCQIPSRFAIEMCNRGWILRNTIIWQKPNAMPSSAKDRFNNDFEYVYFFVKNEKYKFNTQMEDCKFKVKDNRPAGMVRSRDLDYNSKYKTIENEKSLRQGMHKDRGKNIIELRKNLPKKELFVKYLKETTSIKFLEENTDIKKTTIEHWFRSDNGFSYPTLEDWNKIRSFLKNDSDVFKDIDFGLTYIDYETDDINKRKYNNNTNCSVRLRNKDYVEYRNLPNIKEFSNYINEKRKELNYTIEYIEKDIYKNQSPHHWFSGESFPTKEDYLILKNLLKLDDRFDKDLTEIYYKSSKKTNIEPDKRIKRAVWKINTEALKEEHIAPFPKKLVETPILASTDEGDIVMDIFMGSGTTGVKAIELNRDFVGIELSEKYIDIAKNRLDKIMVKEGIKKPEDKKRKLF